ncbi:MAG TPA: hypothetical protein VMM56_14415 [Planctomycetaceae bacterium]|nr:hypothetical protein [Planctomycetaceae bacterium]
MSLPVRVRSAVCFAMLGLLASQVIAQDRNSPRHSASLLPESTVLYAELPDLAGLVDAVEKHPLTRKVYELDQYKQALQDPKYAMFQVVLKTIEGKLGMTWKEGIAALTKGGICLGFSPEENGAVLIIRAKDAASLDKIRNTFFELARGEAARQGQPDPIEEQEYRGQKVYKAGEAKFATLDDRLILASNDKLGKAVLDRYLDGKGSSLETNPRWNDAKSLLKTNPTAWAWLDVQKLRDLGAAKPLFQEKSDNPVLELLLGGLSGTLRNTPFVVGTLEFDVERIAVSLKSPHRAEWVDESRTYSVGADGRAQSPPLLEPEQTVLSIGAYRDFSEMWLNASNLYVDKIDDGISQANANLSTLFGGKDFGEDILGSFQPGFRFVAARQTYAEDRPIPSIKVPSFAFVMEFKEEQTAAPAFRRMYQNLIGFLNIVGGMNGNPQMELETETIGDTKINSATFIPDDREDLAAASIHFNFSPTITNVGNLFVIASSRELAIDLAHDLNQSPSADRKTANTQIKVGLTVLTEILNDNRSHLVSQNMLSEGRSREEAEQQIGLLLEGLSLLNDFQFRLNLSESDASIGVELRFRQD